MRTIKGFDHELKCRGFQYEVGKTYTIEGKVKLCDNGFHAIRDDVNPLRVFDYYPPAINGNRSRYCIVDIEGDILTDEEKVCGSKITIIEEIADLRTYVADWLNKYNYSQVSGGDYSQVSGGIRSQVSGGDYSQVSGGIRSQVSGGIRSQVSGGIRSVIAGRGDAEGRESCVIAVRGNGNKVRGGIGSLLVIAEEDYTKYTIIAWKAVIVDGVKVKADTWYHLVDGELKEVEE